MALSDDITTLQKEAAAKTVEAERLAKLSEKYPDLQKYVGRWNKIAYYSKSVNGQVSRFDLRHNCGCCNDSPLELWPYLETPDGNIYSDPPVFRIGERHWISGDKPYDGWKEDLQKAGIHESIIGTIELYFKKQIEERKSLLEEEDP